jgi:hypothetical protein
MIGVGIEEYLRLKEIVKDTYKGLLVHSKEDLYFLFKEYVENTGNDLFEHLGTLPNRKLNKEELAVLLCSAYMRYLKPVRSD